MMVASMDMMLVLAFLLCVTGGDANFWDSAKSLIPCPLSSLGCKKFCQRHGGCLSGRCYCGTWYLCHCTGCCRDVSHVGCADIDCLDVDHQNSCIDGACFAKHPDPDCERP
ncbi:tenascin-like [Ornithodoros turicata]|uniref:tenascin-like n=1 Tax=Ornithodoros turicata TaxID=34597 RepID=UPI003139C684